MVRFPPTGGATYNFDLGQQVAACAWIPRRVCKTILSCETVSRNVPLKNGEAICEFQPFEVFALLNFLFTNAQ